jgi:hypothetical protein
VLTLAADEKTARVCLLRGSNPMAQEWQYVMAASALPASANGLCSSSSISPPGRVRRRF